MPAHKVTVSALNTIVTSCLKDACMQISILLPLYIQHYHYVMDRHVCNWVSTFLVSHYQTQCRLEGTYSYNCEQGITEACY